MKITRNLEFHAGTKEEKLPDFNPDFPYIYSRAELNHYRDSFVPWHWHKAVELFYIESGELTYHTPNGTLVFPTGSGGFVNSNVLHMTTFQSHKQQNVQLLHIFDPSLIAGHHGGLIEQNYIMPLITAPQMDIIPLYPDIQEQTEILQLILQAFQISENSFGYELKIREALSQIWFQLLELSRSILPENSTSNTKSNDKLKSMMVYIHEHYSEKLSIPELASTVFLSERECYRVFQNCLHMTPAEYLRSYRLQMASQMLVNTHESITLIAHSCGFGNSSHFGKLFREHTGCSPLEYRQKWQNHVKS